MWTQLFPKKPPDPQLPDLATSGLLETLKSAMAKMAEMQAQANEGVMWVKIVCAVSVGVSFLALFIAMRQPPK